MTGELGILLDHLRTSTSEERLSWVRAALDELLAPMPLKDRELIDDRALVSNCVH